jgi:hypothetical protein
MSFVVNQHMSLGVFQGGKNKLIRVVVLPPKKELLVFSAYGSPMHFFIMKSIQYLIQG